MAVFQSATAALMWAEQSALRFTKRGVNHGKVPIKSFVTRICPSQSDPLPMPMVGTAMLWEISLATGGVTRTEALETFAIAVPASLVAGYVLGRIALWILALHREAPTAIIIQFCSTFGVQFVDQILSL